MSIASQYLRGAKFAEGEYTTWTQKWTTTVTIWARQIVIDETNGFVYFVDRDDRFGILKLSDGSTVKPEEYDYDGALIMMSYPFSIRKKYFVIPYITPTPEEIHVYRAGTLIATLVPNPRYVGCACISMSDSGKYIVFSNGNNRIYCYEGS